MTMKNNQVLKLIIFVLIIITIVFVYHNIDDMCISKADDYIYVINADTLKYGDVILKRFVNLKLFKVKDHYAYNILYNKDSSVVKEYLKRNPKPSHIDSDIIEMHLNRGSGYLSRYIEFNYKYIPDTIIANGYEVMHVSDFEVMQEYLGQRLLILSYKYKK